MTDLEKKIENLIKENKALIDKYNTLELFVKEELGLNPKIEASNCQIPTNYCADCRCGKKERLTKENV